MAKGNDELNAAAVAALEKSHELNSELPLATQIKVAIFIFMLGELGIKADAEEAGEAYKAWMATPTWFGASANSMTKAGIVEERSRSEGKKPIGRYTG